MATIGKTYRREISAAAALVALLVIVAIVAPSFFAPGNLRDLIVNNVPTLLIAIGMTLVILVGQIDIPVGSQFAVCSVAAGVLAKTGLPMPLVFVAVMLTGALMGALNGTLIGWLRLPSIIVTLAMLVMWRDCASLDDEGAWVRACRRTFNGSVSVRAPER
jgi:rhamnose transport system permease protein